MFEMDLRLLLLLHRARAMRRKREFWVHPLLLKRPRAGEYNRLFPLLRQFPMKFHRYMRMDIVAFDKLKSLIEHRLQKHSIRKPISVEERLVLTLQHLGYGRSYMQLRFSFLIGLTTVRRIVEKKREPFRKSRIIEVDHASVRIGMLEQEKEALLNRLNELIKGKCVSKLPPCVNVQLKKFGDQLNIESCNEDRLWYLWLFNIKDVFGSHLLHLQESGKLKLGGEFKDEASKRGSKNTSTR
uniref:PORR domain-containing protein n=1 Tax=Ditylenchus dipsaci TaxID=166011 RepID=A0A915D6H9_9BILA